MIVDNHVHFDTPDAEAKLLAEHARMGVEQVGILVAGRIAPEPGINKLAEGVWLKKRHPQRVFLLGGFDFTGLFAGGTSPDVPFEKQLQDLMDMGCDGLKLITGKPTVRKTVDVPLDHPVYEPFLRLLEETQFPVLWHVGDPPEFWDANAVPLWAKQNRWWYDETHPPKEQIDREIAAVFRKHPRLNLVLPHFFFLSDQLDQAAELLDAYPSYYLDTAPGIEMQHNFTRNYEKSRAFFVKYADRIIMGTDIGFGNHFTGPDRGPLVKRWLEEDGVIKMAEDPCFTPDERGDIRGLGLPKDALQKIMAGNFHRWMGRTTPRPLNMPKALEVLNDLRDKIFRRGESTVAIERILHDLK